MADPAYLAGLHARCFPPAARWDTAAMAGLLEMPGCLVEASDSGLVMLRVVADEAEILTLGVVPEARRQGGGRLLLELSLELARAAGARKMFLDVAAGNVAARALYEQRGFAEVGRRRKYYEDGDDALVMELALALAP